MKKKPLIALVLVALVGIIGGTIAYFSQNLTVENIFKTKPYGATLTEEFESPENWLPGTTTKKEAYVENTGEVEVAVRAKVSAQSWTSAKGGNLPLQQNGKDVAIINYDSNDEWELKSDGYYYYKKTLAPGAKTATSFIKSVTFNKDTEIDLDCTETATSKSCKSKGTGYDGATYKLTILIETIQADARSSVWKN